jgi:hypothetical protein
LNEDLILLRLTVGSELIVDSSQEPHAPVELLPSSCIASSLTSVVTWSDKP